ncbi:MAG: hypothetical protein PHW10_01210 [Candidatus Peribacteraceae bacterium]|nr:hypothetical protein [Candidatus Peribacteraceae bacterium]
MNEKRCVLVVEDDDEFQEILVEGLGKRLHEMRIVVAATVEDAVDAFQSQPNCAVVLDYDNGVTGNLNYLPFYLWLEQTAPDFARDRVILHTVRYRDEMREIFEAAHTKFFPAYAHKGKIDQLATFIQSLPPLSEKE